MAQIETDISKIADEDFAALVAEKQKFFEDNDAASLIVHFQHKYNSMPNEDVMFKYASAVKPYSSGSSSTLKNMMRSIFQIETDHNTQKLLAVMSLIGAKDSARQILEDRAGFTVQKEKNLWPMYFSDTSNRNYIFENAYRYDYLQELYFIAMAEDSHIPSKVAHELTSWCNGKGINLKQMLMDYELPTISDNAPVLEPDAASIEPEGAFIDINAIIAEKQRFFDETDAATVNSAIGKQLGLTQKQMDDYATELGADTHGVSDTSYYKNALRITAQKNWDENAKKHMYINLTLTSMKSILNVFHNGYDRSAYGEKLQKSWSEYWHDISTRHYVFENARRNGYLPELYFIVNARDSFMPAYIADDLNAWCENKNIDLKQMLVDYELPVIEAAAPTIKPAEPGVEETQSALEPLPETEEQPNLETIFVDGTLVDIGQASEMLAVDRMMGEDEPKRQRKRIEHIHWLAKAIPDLLPLDGGIKIYRSRAEAAKGEDFDFSHQVIEFKTTDGRKHQIATNNWYGGGTYVIKPAIDINPESPKLVHVPDLLGSGKAWPVRCVNETQYTLAALELCEKQVEELQPYIPKLSWANKALDVTQTCIALLKETGQRIKTNDREPLTTGPLRGITTAGRMAQAINHGAVLNLGADDVPDFYEKLFEKFPELRGHLNKPAIPAKRVFDEAVDFIRANDIVPQNGFLDDIELAGLPAETISRFFAMSAEGCVTGVRNHIPSGAALPRNLDDFMVASGLAVRGKKGDLWPNYEHPELADAGRALSHG